MRDNINLVVCRFVYVFLPNVAGMVLHALGAGTRNACLRVAVVVGVHDEHLKVIELGLLQERKH